MVPFSTTSAVIQLALHKLAHKANFPQ